MILNHPLNSKVESHEESVTQKLLIVANQQTTDNMQSEYWSN